MAFLTGDGFIKASVEGLLFDADRPVLALFGRLSDCVASLADFESDGPWLDELIIDCSTSLLVVRV